MIITLHKQTARVIEMINKNMPAMPLVDSGFGQYKPEVFPGLTKREMFAMHAPEVPEWFKKNWEESNSENSDFFVLVSAYCEFSNNDYEYPEISVNGQMALIKAWRYAYADLMLGE